MLPVSLECSLIPCHSFHLHGMVGRPHILLARGQPLLGRLGSSSCLLKKQSILLVVQKQCCESFDVCARN
jgi:hypothetical protein